MTRRTQCWSRASHGPVATLILLAIAGAASAQSPTTAMIPASPEPRNGSLPPEPAPRHAAAVAPSRPAIYIVRLRDQPLALYDGDDPSLAAIPRLKGGKRLDLASTQAKSYVKRLQARHRDFLAAASAVTSQDVSPIFEFEHALNGMVLVATPEQAELMRGLPDVLRIDLSVDEPLETDRGPAFLGAPAIWSGAAPGSAPGTRGEGTVLGAIDNGANFDHPSFAAVGADGYSVVNPLGPGVFLGACNPPGEIVTCNDKMLGAYDFATPLVPPTNATNLPGGGEADQDHGSHTTSIAVGNVVNAIASGLPVQISGVAPHANVVVYDACYRRVSDGAGLCPSAATIAAVNQAIADNIVDVINYPIGGGSSPWADAVSQAFLAASNAGIVIATSASNLGPTAGSVGHLEPWTITTASASHDRLFTNASVSVTGPGSPGPPLVDVGGIVGTGPAFGGSVSGNFDVHVANVEGCTSGGGIPPATFSGPALIRRGTCGFLEKVQNATAAGATGVVVYNDRAGPPTVMGALETTSIPSMMIGQSAGSAIQGFLLANPAATGTMGPTATVRTLSNEFGDVMASASGRGPALMNVPKPTLAAPGVAILGAFSDQDAANGTPAEFGVLSGTSMSSSHAAGSALLLRALKPSWSPAAIQAALATTGTTIIAKEDGVAAANPFDRGAGRIDLNLAAAAGLLLNESNANYAAANPATGGDPRTLNLPGLMDDSCAATCSWQRRFTNATASNLTWNATLVLPAGVVGSVTPSVFALPPGATQVVTIALDVSAAPVGNFAFGQLDLAPTSGPAVPQHLPIAVRPITPNIVCESFAATMPEVPKDIPDLGQVTSALSVSLDGIVTDVNVISLAGRHPWMSDLDFTLASPGAASSAVIVATSCGDDDDFDLNLDDGAAGGAGGWPCTPPPVGQGGTYKPSNPLAAFNGDPAAGNWSLTVADGGAQDVGSLDTWGLEICVAVPALASQPESGSTLFLEGTSGQQPATRNISFFNDTSNGSTLNVTGCAIAGSPLLQVSPPALQSANPGDAASLTVTCQIPATPGTTVEGTLTCASNDPAHAQVEYGITCASRVPEAPVVVQDPITADDADAGDLFGAALAISSGPGDIEVLAIGAPLAGDDDGGRVYVYERSPQDDVLADALSVKVLEQLARGGSRAILGSPVAVLSTGSHERKGSKLIGDKFGTSVAVSPDGGTIVVGAPFFGGTGALFVYTKPGLSWTALGEPDQVIRAPATQAGATAAEFGAQVSFAPDGAVVVGAPASMVGGASDAGAAYVLRQIAGNFAQSGGPVLPSTIEAGARFGSAVATGENLVVIGAPFEDENGQAGSGAAYAYANAGGSVGTALRISRVGGSPGANIGDKFGSGIGISRGHVVIGAPDDTTAAGFRSGSARVFRRDTGATMSEVATLVPEDGDDQGAGSAVATNGSLFVVGAPLATVNGNPGQGRVYTFDFGDLPIASQRPDATLENTTGEAMDGYGSALALSPRRLVVGVPADDNPLASGPEAIDQGRAEPSVLDRIHGAGFE